MGMSPEDWAATPSAVRGLVQELLQRLGEVAARLNQTSRNSSNPPSADPPSANPRPTKALSGRQSGGQPGSEGHGRKLKAAAEVAHRIEVRPKSCEPRGTLLLGEDPEPERHHGTAVPRITPSVTEYRRHRRPAPMPTGSFGPRVQATGGYVTGRVGASQREVQDILATLCQTEVRVGSGGRSNRR
jgi:transposase